MTTDKNNSPVTVPMWWDGGDRAITAREKATIEEHGPSCYTIPLLPAQAVDPEDPWRGLYLPARMPAPSEYGDLFHPDIPRWPDDREDALDKLVHAQGFDFHIVAGDFTEAALEDADDLYWQEMRTWNPEAPEGEWRLAWKGDTEDGPYAWFVRPMALRPEPAALAARQPGAQDQPAFQLAGSEPLWCLHVLGMDDVHPAPSKAHAEKAAAWHNEQFKEQAARIGITVEAVVAPWPHSAESHAAGVADFIPEWLIPQWQLDALEAKDTAPAQGIDLGTGVKAIAAERERQLQAEGFTRDGDQQYRRGELAKAATAYVQLAAMDLEAGTRDHIAWHGPAAVWPWAPEWWKPVDARRDLVRAGALIAAQIDLIDQRDAAPGVDRG